MSIRDSVKHRFALSDDGYRYLCRSSFACIMKDLALMFPVMVLFMFVCDIMGGPENPYDFDLEPWGYVAMIAVCVVLIAVTYTFEYNETYFNTYKESSAKRIALAERIRKLPMSYFGKKDPTDLTVRIMGDCTMQEQSMSHWFPELIGSMICIAVLGVMILVFNPVMGAASLWPIPVSFTIVILSKRFQDKYNRYKFDRTLEATEGVQEFLETSRDLRVNDAGRRYLDGLFGKLDRVEGAEFKAEYMVAIFVVFAQLVLKFGIVTTALAGGYLMIAGSLDIFVFIAFLIVISRLYDPLNNALQNIAAMINAEYNMERLQEIEDQPLQEGSTDFRPEGYDIVFDHVRFSYDGDRNVLRDVSFTARQGEVTALIGPSGEGKTTAAKLAARFWDLDDGVITVGGVDISEIDPETLLSCYSIGQHPHREKGCHRRGGDGGCQGGELRRLRLEAPRRLHDRDWGERCQALGRGEAEDLDRQGAAEGRAHHPPGRGYGVPRHGMRDAGPAGHLGARQGQDSAHRGPQDAHHRRRRQDRRPEGRDRGRGRQPRTAHVRGRYVRQHGAPAEPVQRLVALTQTAGKPATFLLSMRSGPMGPMIERRHLCKEVSVRFKGAARVVDLKRRCSWRGTRRCRRRSCCTWRCR